MTQKVFLNDSIIDIDKACISPNDSGFLYGAGLFETMCALNSKVFALKDHMDRLFFSMGALQFVNSFTREFIEEAIYKVIDANKLVDARIRLTVTNGPVSMTEKPKPTLFISATDYQPYPDQFYKDGIRVILTSFRQNPTNPVFRHKTTNYLPKLMALNNARQHGAAEAIWFTTENLLAEGCVSNVFIVKDEKIFTPPIETPVLPGVARENLLEILTRNSIDYEEKTLTINELLEADEVFLTNVIMRVLPVHSIEKHVVGDGKVGKTTKKMLDLYNKELNRQCCVVPENAK